ncbi:FAD-dependent monooxygenase [Pseudactinotalea sp. Z1748]|uniref:FAD-dependent monooxygenase n=1 Tax=Pseudactinotalea sp. Z1748 TaxID=3413027 RepID=UPI003C7E410F
MTNWFASVREDVLAEQPSYRNVAELLTALFGDWHPIVREVVTRLDPVDIDQRVLYDMPPIGSLSRDHRVILGDAAHAMAPNAGRGACEAIVDAVTLAESLSTAGSTTQGLQDFDRRRRRAGQRMVRASRVLSRISTARRLPTVRYRAMNVLSRFASTRQADDNGNDEGRHGHT